MGWILLIEENLSFVADVEEAMVQIDPKIEIVRFAKSSEFLAWMEKLVAHDPEIEPAIPKDKFLGLITAIETWRFRDVKLIGKFKALFVQKKMAEKEEDLFVIFTGFETPHFLRKRFEYKAVNNFIFKPFDKLLLKQMTDIALKGRAAVKTHYTHVHKSDTKIEMLKEIDLSRIGELSFTTVSDQSIDVGVTAKYYADFFETPQHRSALAQVIRVEPHVSLAAQAAASQHVAKNPSASVADIPTPLEPEQSKLLDVTLRFFAIDQHQSFNIQKLAQVDKKRIPLASSGIAPDKYEFVFISHESSDLITDVRPSFERFYDHKTSGVNSIAEFQKELHTFTAKHLFVFIDHAHTAGNDVAEIDAIKKMHPSLSLFILSRQIFSEALEVELSAGLEDIFYAPFNRSYIVKGLKLRYPDLSNKEELFENVHAVEKSIHVSNPVRLLEVSEASVVISYRRELPVGCFREFVLWLPNEAEVPTLLAQCNFSEKATDGKSFNCHFIFFGLGDHELKFIRRWMLLQYVDAKQKSDAG